MNNSFDNIEDFAKDILHITLRDNQGDFLYYDLQRQGKRITTVCSMMRRWGLTTSLLTYALWNAWKHGSAVEYILPSKLQIEYVIEGVLSRMNVAIERTNATIRFVEGGRVKFASGMEPMILSRWGNQKHISIYDETSMDSDIFGKFERNDNYSIIYAMASEQSQRDNVFQTWQEERHVNPDIHAATVGDEW